MIHQGSSGPNQMAKDHPPLKGVKAEEELNLKNNNKAVQGKPGKGMMIESSVENSNGYPTINPFKNFKINEGQGFYIGRTTNPSPLILISCKRSNGNRNVNILGSIGKGMGFTITQQQLKSLNDDETMKRTT